MGIGVLIAFFLTFLTLPVLFYFFPGPKYVREKKKDHFWRKRLERWFVVILRKRGRILIVSAVVILLSIFGLLKIETNNLLMDDLSKDEPLKQDFDYLDKNYGGVRPFQHQRRRLHQSNTVRYYAIRYYTILWLSLIHI